MFRVVVTLLLISSIALAFKSGQYGFKQGPRYFFNQRNATRQNITNNAWRYAQLGATACPKGFIRYDKLCIFPGTNKVTWYEALNICKFVLGGAYLLEIYDTNVQKYLIERMAASGLEGEYWVGGNNIRNRIQYVWTESGRSVASWLWDENEPNDVNDWEHCSELRQNGRLNDNDCHALRMYMCGYDL